MRFIESIVWLCRYGLNIRHTYKNWILNRYKSDMKRIRIGYMCFYNGE